MIIVGKVLFKIIYLLSLKDSLPKLRKKERFLLVEKGVALFGLFRNEDMLQSLFLKYLLIVFVLNCFRVLILLIFT